MKIHNKPVFRNNLAEKYFEMLSQNSDVYECGVDDYHRIYFALLNGDIIRYTRSQFIHQAEHFYLDIYTH